jgi:large subunit ribosomal protein L19
MSNSLVRNFGNKDCKASVPDLQPGMIVKVHQKIKEGNKERIQVFQGTIIKIGAGNGVSQNFTVRKISAGIGVERCFPTHSPNVVKIEVLRQQKVRRSKLEFLRELSGKALRLKEVPLKLREQKFEQEVVATTEEKTEEVATS